jgi:RNA polymerase sigma-70 factor, ECF subfamily
VPVTTSFGLIERAKAGDEAAFERLFTRYARRLQVLLHYKLGPELSGVCEVDDLLQETFLRAFRSLDSFVYESPGSFLRWLASIAGHVAIDAARHLNRQRRGAAQTVRFRSPSNPGGPEPADTRTPSRVLSQKETVAALLQRLDALPENYRQAILLAKIEGLSTAELAERLGQSRQAAAVLLHRALKRFRALAEA